jgi:hypothetical protein
LVTGTSGFYTSKPSAKEEAKDRGLIFFDAVQGIRVVRATPAGLRLLERIVAQI